MLESCAYRFSTDGTNRIIKSNFFIDRTFIQHKINKKAEYIPIDKRVGTLENSNEIIKSAKILLRKIYGNYTISIVQLLMLYYYWVQQNCVDFSGSANYKLLGKFLMDSVIVTNNFHVQFFCYKKNQSIYVLLFCTY